MILRDHSGEFEEVEEFIVSFTNEYDKTRLGLVELKITHGRQYFSGICNYPPKRTRNQPYHIICRVSKHNVLYNRFPITVKENVGTNRYALTDSSGAVSGQGWSYVTEDITFYDQNEVMVFIFGHEFWHFLCKTKQERGNWETKANKFGIEVLDTYRNWRVGQEMRSLVVGERG